jgi:Zn-dependent protease with chaperone function
VNIPAVENKALFRGLVWKRNAYLVLALSLEALVLYVLGSLRIGVEEGAAAGLGYTFGFQPIAWQTFLWIGIILFLQVLFAEWGFLEALKGEGMVQLYPEDKSEGRTFGGLSGGEVVGLVQDLARDFGVGKVDRIVVSEKPDPNAYTAHLFGMYDVVVLHSNLLEVLPRPGVRAIIAHELGHVRRWDSMVYQLARLPMSFAWVIAILTFSHLFEALFLGGGLFWLLARVAFIVGVLWLTTVVLGVLRLVMNLASQQSELLADAYAAQATGWETHLNALLLVGERAEALTALSVALQELPAQVEAEMSQAMLLRILNRFPPRELDEEAARAQAPRLFIEDQLELLRNGLGVPLSDEEIRDLAARGARHYQDRKKSEEEKAAADGAPPEPPAGGKAGLADWRDFDRDASGHLDPHEVAALVAELRKDPGRMLFRQFLVPAARWQSHPTMRDRILSLYDLFAAGVR